jgi:WD40 repeat protein
MSESIEFEHLIGSNAIAGGVGFHPNGKNYITAVGGTLLVGDLTNPQYQEFLRKHDNQVTCIALSRNGNYIASGQKGDNSNIYIWDFASSKVLYSLEEHDHMIQCVAFSDDEKLLVSVGSFDDRKLIVWDMSNGCIIASSNKIPNETLCVAHGGFVRDIKRRDTDHYQICTGGKEGMVVWDLDPFSGDIESHPVSGDARATVSRSITAVMFSADKEHIFGVTTSGDYAVASVKHLRIIQVVQATKMGLRSLLTYEQGVIVGCGDSTIKFFDNTGRFARETKLDGAVLGLSFGPDRRELLALTGSGTVMRVNVNSGQYIIISESHTSSVVAVAYAIGQSDRFATASSDGTIRVWDAAEYAVLTVAVARREQEGGVTPFCLAFADMIFSGWSDGRVLAHSAETGAILWFIDNAHPGGTTALILSHNKRFLLTGGSKGEVRLWELRSRELVSHLKEHAQRITALALFDDDTMAVSASRDRCLLRWDLKTEKRVHCHMQRMGGINSVAIGKDERQILSVGQEKRLVYWNITQNEPTRQFSLAGESDEGRCVAMLVNCASIYCQFYCTH